MRTIGRFLKEVRLKKKLSKEELEKETKIKRGFIAAIEKENWEALPEFPVVIGFVKSIAKALGVNERQAVALLRRDYPPKSLPISPKPDVSEKFIFSPRITFLIGTAAISILIAGYLIFSYLRFISPPSLSVIEPRESQLVKEAKVRVLGKTDTDATIKVNNQSVLVDSEGNFEAMIEIAKDTSEIEIKATSRSGKETAVRRTINVRLE